MKNLLAVVVLLLLCSCAWSAEGLRDAYPSWTEGEIETVLAGKIRVGMTAAQLVAAWGNPTRWHRTRYSSGVSIYWHYRGRMIHTENGVITSISAFN